MVVLRLRFFLKKKLWLVQLACASDFFFGGVALPPVGM
jgi:hypothetical protein